MDEQASIMNHAHNVDNDELDEIYQPQDEQLDDREDAFEEAVSDADVEEAEAGGRHDEIDDVRAVENNAAEQVQGEEEFFGEINVELWLEFCLTCDKVRVNAPDVTQFDVSLILNDAGAVDLATALEGNTHLERLNLHLGPDMTAEGATALIQGIRGSNVRTIQVFWPGGANFMPLELAQVYLQITTNTTIDILNLQFPIDEANLIQLGRAMHGNESLKVLCIRVDGLTHSGVLRLADGILHSRLHTMMLTGVPDASTAVIRSSLINGIRYCSTLLDIRLCGVGEDLFAVAALVLPKLHAFTFTPYGVLSSGQVRFFASSLRNAKELAFVRIRGGDWSGDKLHHLFHSLLDYHPSIKCVELIALQNFGDEAVATLVEHWDLFSGIQTLNLDGNNIGPQGVLRLLKALSSHVCMRLSLNNNKGIGYDGLGLIGKELAGKRLFYLCLCSVATWIDYDDITCHDAVVQTAKRAAASAALLEGVRGNVYLLQLELDGLNLLPQVLAEIKVYLMANHRGRLLILEQYKQPPPLFCFLLAQQAKMHHDVLFLLLRELPTVIASRQRSDT